MAKTPSPSKPLLSRLGKDEPVSVGWVKDNVPVWIRTWLHNWICLSVRISEIQPILRFIVPDFSPSQICNPCTSKLRAEMLCHGFAEDHAFIHSDLLALGCNPFLANYLATSAMVCWQILNRICKSIVGQSKSKDNALIHSDFACAGLQIHPQQCLMLPCHLFLHNNRP